MMPIPSRERLQRQSPRMLGRRSLPVAALPWLSVAVTLPWIMLRALAGEDIPWAGVHICQVDERVAPDGHLDRNLTHLRVSLVQHAPLHPEQIHAMPVEIA